MNFQGRRFKKDEKIFSEWFPREGDNAVFRAQAVDRVGSTTKVTFKFYTKNSDVVGNGAVVDKPPAAGGGAYTLVIDDPDPTGDHGFTELVIKSETTTGEGFDELVRLEAHCEGSAATDWLLCRFFTPIFYNWAVPS